MEPISIHALREESDAFPDDWRGNAYISIHALREESDLSLSMSAWFLRIFQSTLSVRRATTIGATISRTGRFQSTLSVRRATLTDYGVATTPNFNPRSP